MCIYFLFIVSSCDQLDDYEQMGCMIADSTVGSPAGASPLVDLKLINPVLIFCAS